MNDIEKAIDILKEKLQISTTGLTVGELNDQKRALDLAISALEKQASRKVNEITQYESILDGYCPCCQRYITSILNYCPDCGQCLDWEESNE